MGKPFARWANELANAKDDTARQALVATVAMARARSLLDVDLQRHAAWTLAQLHAALGRPEAAIGEARQLESLLTSAPEPTPDERVAVSGLLKEIGAGRPRVPRPEPSHPNRDAKPGRPGPSEGRGPREPRGLRDPRPEARRVGDPRVGDPRGLGEARAYAEPRAVSRPSWDAALDAARQGAWTALEALLPPGEGPRSGAIRAYAALRQGNAAAAMHALEVALFGGAPDPKAERPAKADKADKAERAPRAAKASGPSLLTPWLGDGVPTDRDALVDAVDAAVTADNLDAIAAAALRDHVAREGLQKPAPWWIGLVARALAAHPDGETKAAVVALAAEGAWAVTAYSERPFVAAVEVLAAAGAVDAASLRRGILHRGEPAEFKLWTLRLTRNGEERMVTFAPYAPNAPDTALAERLARRVADLAPGSVLVATGPTLGGLRDAATAAGLSALDAASPAETLAALDATPAIAPRAAKPAARAEADGAPAAARGPGPMEAIAALFNGDADPSEADYAAPLAAVRRSFRAFVAIRQTIAARAAAEVDARLATLLRAVHEATPTHVRLAEGASVALRVAAAHPDGAVAAILRGADALAARYGGPGLDGALATASAVHAAQGTVGRVLLGLSRRERDASPVLAALPPELGGLWRLLVAHGERRGEVWWVDGLTPEGQAAVPQLLLEDRPRVIVAAEGVAIPGAVSLADAPEALRTAFATWPVSAAAAEDEGEG
jgi:hypothetical protein